MYTGKTGEIRTLDDFMKYLASRDFELGTIIDVGACYGTPALLNSFPDAYHVLIEPLPQMEERLQHVANAYGGEYHAVALADFEGTVQLRYPVQHPDQATLLPTLESLSVHEGKPAEDIDTCEVRVTTLDALFLDKPLKRPILLKTDCQGLDLEAIKGGERFINDVEIVVMETLFYRASIARDTPIFSDVVILMKKYGFEVFDIVNYQLRPLDSALAYVDVVFVQSDSVLRVDQKYC